MVMGYVVPWEPKAQTAKFVIMKKARAEARPAAPMENADAPRSKEKRPIATASNSAI